MDGPGAIKVAYNCNKGNYKGYYKMRPESNNRLQYLSDVWFRGKSCLDIGCNDGQFCIALAEHFAPSFILGIDPDFVLIDSAQSRLKRLIYAANQAEIAAAAKKENAVSNAAEIKSKPIVAFRSGFLPRALAVKAPVQRPVAAYPATSAVTPKLEQRSKGDTQTVQDGGIIATSATASVTTLATLSANAFPHNIVFKARDVFALSCTLSSQKEGKYDTITCFSVSKWVHLNGGDSKLLEFFCRLYSLVRTGGRVIIEYQPWRSYENNKSTSEVTKSIFPTIQIKPDLFEWVLTFIVGFEIEARCGVHLDQAKGFDRPILVLRRPSSAISSSTSGSAPGGNVSGMTSINAKDSTNGNNSSGSGAAGDNRGSVKKASSGGTDGYRDGKKLWENVNSFGDLCNIVYKRIQRGTVRSIANTSGGNAVPAAATSSSSSIGSGAGGSSTTGSGVLSKKRSADAVEEMEVSNKKMPKKSKK